jgi:renalase
VREFSINVGIIGAGLAGLTCAQQLENAGFSGILLDKSRGIGGRVATRRVTVGDREIRLDHGLPCLEKQGQKTAEFIENLLEKKRIRSPGENIYTCPDGMNSIAKFLAGDLPIRRDCLVTRLEVQGDRWLLQGKDGEILTVSALVLAIPAPQALSLLQASNLSTFLPELASVVYDPCITVIAGYEDSPPIPPITSDFHQIICDSDKRPTPAPTVFVLHSSPDFAARNFDRPDLETVKRELLDRSGLPSPQWSQLHRWRYALPRQGLTVSSLSTSDPLPLVCCGDWCGGTGRENSVEAALTSGTNAAKEIERFLRG